MNNEPSKRIIIYLNLQKSPEQFLFLQTLGSAGRGGLGNFGKLKSGIPGIGKSGKGGMISGISIGASVGGGVVVVVVVVVGGAGVRKLS